ncbi:hypothetical protein RHSIM_Rhsim02G0254600 [Rhododendron simsii]|uniref:Tim10-like domain-containing protein n=1 Tax=Rhododendron simsii TaxID=118357 RepID=A0A834LS54_RHOSS|nr:hypothetical protein RHSIM_Rhsim02G0254600 [Rhododendron simsii]
MDSFTGASSGSSSSSPQMSKDDFMDQLKTQLAQAYAEEFLEVLSLSLSLSTNEKIFNATGLSMFDSQYNNNGIGEGKKINSFNRHDAMIFDNKLTGLFELFVNPETVRGKCFEKCITKPGSSLSGSESSCISRCVDRYIEATGIISRALFSSSR